MSCAHVCQVQPKLISNYLLDRGIFFADDIFMLNVRQKKKKNLRWIPITLLVLVIAAVLVLIWAFRIEPHMLRLTKYTVSSDQLPESWDGRKIGFLTDIHAGPGFGSEQLSDAVDRIMDENPDIILYGGDLVDSSTPLDDTEFASGIIAELSRLEAPFGKFAVIGNHDNRLRHELETAISWLEESGFQVLINQALIVDGIWLGGLDESYFGNPDLDSVLNGPDDAFTFGDAEETDLYRIMLMHQPDYLPSYVNNERVSALDLVFSGHSHNGQITLFGQPLIKVHQGSEFVLGQYQPFENSEGQLIVSGGLGTVIIHARLFNLPEIVTVDLVKE